MIHTYIYTHTERFEHNTSGFYLLILRGGYTTIGRMVTVITSETEFEALKYVYYAIGCIGLNFLFFPTLFFFRSNGLSVIHFYADWSEPCQHMNNILDDLATESEFQVPNLITFQVLS